MPEGVSAPFSVVPPVSPVTPDKGSVVTTLQAVSWMMRARSGLMVPYWLGTLRPTGVWLYSVAKYVTEAM
ncbi:MAG: hypothetical protein AVDCRST_MAG56-820 [uncultured Cytophagales bacterium]|uniref:Uncharacterized protein n=1 Tax=uncultured Cytophagales bacterium TaxID=158755 RepID=A0A6J4HQG4_9SPHI|nr:MAG: hypothetical protein AVDCRST_MAG56-820 [uncultured Cytophagales bacterium]